MRDPQGSEAKNKEKKEYNLCISKWFSLSECSSAEAGWSCCSLWFLGGAGWFVGVYFGMMRGTDGVEGD